jgi:trehalose-phosphatase
MATVARSYPRLQATLGKCVWELRPKEGWNKGDALKYLATRLNLTPEDTLYLGDDFTDEDAFAVTSSGLTFRVGGANRSTIARFEMRDHADVQGFLLCVLGVRSGKATVDGCAVGSSFAR